MGHDDRIALGAGQGSLALSILLHLGLLAAAGSMAAVAHPGPGLEMEVIFAAGPASGTPAPLAADHVSTGTPDRRTEGGNEPAATPAPERERTFDDQQDEGAAPAQFDPRETAFPEKKAAEEPLQIEAAGTGEGVPVDHAGLESILSSATRPESSPRKEAGLQLAMQGSGALTGLLAGAPSAFSEAVIIDLPEPAYPRLSRQRGEEGRVVVEMTLGADGEVLAATIVESSRYGRLDRAALKAASRASYRPATRDGLPVGSVLKVAYRFVIDE